VVHASIQGISGVLVPSSDGAQYFFDPHAKECYPVDECPPIQVYAPVRRDMIATILDAMRQAHVVHLR
jgi:hypothetical protein